MSNDKTKVLMLCTGVGRIGRGIETFFADAFEGLKDDPGLDLTLVIGSGTPGAHQHRAVSLSRTGRLARMIGSVLGRDGYTVEQLSSLPWILAAIHRLQPQVVFTSEANLAMRLKRLRRLVVAPCRFMYSNGAPMRGPFPWADYVHQVSPTYRDFAIADGDDPFRHYLVPYGFTIPTHPPDRSSHRRWAARRLLGLPVDRPVILSAGWISRQHKRMDYVVDEVFQMPAPRPLLALIGAMDDSSTELIAEAKTKLGPDGVVVKSVAPGEVPTWYAASDVFVLGSLAEGFGRVYIEALAAGVPVFCHDFPVGRFVNGTEAIYGDFSSPGGLATLLMERSDLFMENPSADRRRWMYARDTFSWPALAPKYREMFQAVAAGPLRTEISSNGCMTPV